VGLLKRANEERDLNRRFDKFVGELLATTYIVASGEAYGCDYVLASHTSALRAVVEAKLHRSAKASSSTVKNAVAQLQRARAAAGADVSILVLNTLPDEAITAEAKLYGVIIYDAELLRSMAIHSYALVAEFDQIQQEALLTSTPVISDVTMEIPRFEALEQRVELQSVSIGSDIYTAISKLKPGRDDASAYERRLYRCAQISVRKGSHVMDRSKEIRCLASV
jgi:hypothetical protein